MNELKKKANKAPEDYTAFWNNFGAVLKEGLVEDVALRDRILYHPHQIRPYSTVT